MKRILCILLAIAMVFALCSCKLRFGGTAVETDETEEATSSKKTTSKKSDKTTSKSKDVDEDDDDDDDDDVDDDNDDDKDVDDDDDDNEVDPSLWNFNNTYFKLTHDKKLTVGYIGGSVTVGTGGDTKSGCWRAYTTKWLKDTYKADVTEINAAIGGSSSVWGAPRYQTWILDKKPDLVFIEFSINDFYNSSSTGMPGEAESAMLMDSMIRQTQKKLPNCDIVVVTVVDSSTIKLGNANAVGHKKAAEYEGVLYLDVTEALLKKVTSNLTNWNKYFNNSDAVHPNEAGYKIYSDYITGELAQKFAESAAAKPSGLKAHTVKASPYNKNVPEKYTLIYGKNLKYDKAKWALKDGVSGNKFGSSYIYAKETGASVSCEFTGNTVSLFGVFAADSNIEISLDGGKKTKTIASSKAAGEVLLWTDLENTKHTLTFKITGKVTDEKTCQLSCIAAGTR